MAWRGASAVTGVRCLHCLAGIGNGAGESIIGARGNGVRVRLAIHDLLLFHWRLHSGISLNSIAHKGNVMRLNWIILVTQLNSSIFLVLYTGVALCSH